MLLQGDGVARHIKSFQYLFQSDTLPISERIKYHVTCMCFSAINGFGPAYPSELLHVYTPSCTLRSPSDTRMLKIQQYKHKTYGFHAFSCFGPHIWNSLPPDLRHGSTLSSFKAKLNTSSAQSIFVPSNISIQFQLQSLHVRACACMMYNTDQ